MAQRTPNEKAEAVARQAKEDGLTVEQHKKFKVIEGGDTEDVTACLRNREFAKMIPYSEVSSQNIGEFLCATGHQLRFNTLTKKLERRECGSQSHAEWEEIEDSMMGIIWSDIYEMSFELPKGQPSRGYLSQKDRNAIVDRHLLNNKDTLHTNPIKSWLDGKPVADDLPDWNPIEELWNIEKPINCSAKDWEDYVYKTAWYPFVAAVANAYEFSVPPARISTVYIGDQEIGKSDWLKSSLPDEMYGDWANDLIIQMGEDGKREMVLACAGKVFVEVSEGLGWGVKAREQAKSFLTNRYPRIRLAYNREQTKFENRWFNYFTSNFESTLPFDASGYSRYAPLELTPKPEWATCKDIQKLCDEHLSEQDGIVYGAQVVAKVKSMRDKIWSGARKIFETHGVAWLKFSPELKVIQNQLGHIYSAQSAYDAMLDNALSDAGHSDHGVLTAFTKLDLARICEMAEMSDGNVRSERHTFIDRCLQKWGFKFLYYDNGRHQDIQVDVLKSKPGDATNKWARPRHPVIYQPQRCAGMEHKDIKAEARRIRDLLKTQFEDDSNPDEELEDDIKPDFDDSSTHFEEKEDQF